MCVSFPISISAYEYELCALIIVMNKDESMIVGIEIIH